jgi:hypothetical protein
MEPELQCEGLCTRIILTIAHVDHDESNNADSNLLALCQFCHLHLDREDNLRRRRASVRARAAVGTLPGYDEKDAHAKGD